MVTLENWAIIAYVPSPYTAPELAEARLTGDVRASQYRRGGFYHITSTLLEFDSNTLFARTRSREYKLGEIHPDFYEYLRSHNWTIRHYHNVRQETEVAEGKESKGGVNKRPTIPRPPPPKGQGPK